VEEIKSVSYSGRIPLMKTYKSIVAIMFVLALILPAMPVSAKRARSAAIMLTAPSPNPVSVGSEITFDLFLSVNDINPGVAGIDIYLKYNPALVTPVNTGAEVAKVLPDFFNVPIASINTNLPAIQCPDSNGPCVHLAIAGEPQITKSALTARFYFRAIAQGPAEFSVVESTPVAPTLVDADGFPVAYVGAASKWVNIEARASVTGIVQRQGTVVNPNPGNATLACSQVSAAGVGTAYTDRNGSFTLPNLPAGTHTLQAVYSGYLSSAKTIVITPNNPPVISFAATTLRGGDVNGTNSINILDVNIIISKFGQKGVAIGSSDPTKCPAVDESADINDDGLVNISDLAITAGNFGSIGPTPWP
jgi:hypothetical protein